MNDCIGRTLAGVPRASRPEFPKVAGGGSQAMDHYLVTGLDGLVVGVWAAQPAPPTPPWPRSATLVREV